MNKKAVIAISVFCLGLVAFTTTVSITFDLQSLQKPRTSHPSSSRSLSASSDTASQTSDASTEGMTISIPLEYGGPYVVKQEDNLAIFNRDSRPLTISGTTVQDTQRIVVTYTPAFGDKRDSDVYTLQSYTAGDTTWKYSISENLHNIRPGLNEYIVQALGANDRLIDEKTIIIEKEQPRTSQKSSIRPALLNVQWHEPIKRNILDLYNKNDDNERYIHFNAVEEMYSSLAYSALGFDVLTEKSVTSIEETRKRLTEEPVYEVGDVQDGRYAGSKVYVHYWSSRGFGGGDPSLAHFLQKADGSFLRLGSEGSALTKEMPWDEQSAIDASGPKTISINQSKLSLDVCGDSCHDLKFFDASKAKLASSFTDSQNTVYEGENGCFMIKRKDGFLENYSVTINPSITWNDGTSSTIRYVHFPEFGGCGGRIPHCNWVFDRNSEALEQIGKTADGLEVYQEKLTSENIEAFGSGQTFLDYKQGIASLFELYRSLPRYESAKIPTPQEFVKQHPAIYIKDPLGRFLYFRGEQYGPQVECGKPVIYLYPEREQDISVYVKPTGGLTVSDPEYGDGWRVRATPEGSIYNYENGKAYPYLFWEGHGKNYERPQRGFVVAKQEVSALLKEKLAALGLNEKESADFREFWEPKLMVNPYVFVTFIDQGTFNTIAPLIVEPKPDSVIRVFMDYEPLISPIVVESLAISTPKRKGFTVIEWGGALHRNDGGICTAGAFLQ